MAFGNLTRLGYSGKDAKLGIGLSNIYRRIKLFYGDEAEMTIQSKLHWVQRLVSPSLYRTIQNNWRIK